MKTIEIFNECLGDGKVLVPDFNFHPSEEQYEGYSLRKYKNSILLSNETIKNVDVIAYMVDGKLVHLKIAQGDITIYDICEKTIKTKLMEMKLSDKK